MEQTTAVSLLLTSALLREGTCVREDGCERGRVREGTGVRGDVNYCLYCLLAGWIHLKVNDPEFLTPIFPSNVSQICSYQAGFHPPAENMSTEAADMT